MLGFAFAVPAVSAKVLETEPQDWRTQVVRVQIPRAALRAAQDQAVLSAAPAPVADAIARSSARHGVPVALVEAVAWQESHYTQSAISSRGARGVMQLTPATARTLGVDARDLEDNVDGGCAYLAKLLRRYGDTRLALAAYNAGPNIVDRYAGVPPYRETQTYVAQIMARVQNGPAGEA